MQNRSDRMAYEWVLRASLPGLPPTLDWQRDNRGDSTQRGEIPVAADSPVYPALAYMDGHRQEMVRMCQMAELCHLSPTHFRRLFRAVYRTTPNAYLLNLRLENAKYMLHSPTATVAEIARSVGFRDVNYFTRFFKNHTGLTPLKYRRTL